MTQSPTIICIQEHWLFNFENDFFDEIFPQCSTFVKCVDDEEPIPPAVRPRGSAGVAFIWNSSADDRIEPLPDGGNRVALLQVQTQAEPVIIINTYMPTSGSLTGIKYEEILDEVYGIRMKYNGYKFIWAGDMNACPERASTQNDRHFIKFCAENELAESPLTPKTPTFHHFNGYSTSRIDLFITDARDVDLIQEVSVDSRNPLNSSSHDAVSAVLNLPLLDHDVSPQVKSKPARKRTNWSRIDPSEYQALTDTKLEALESLLQQNCHPEIIIERLNKILSECSDACLPKHHGKKRKSTQFTWLPQLKQVIATAKLAFWKWKQVGRPNHRSDPALVEMKLAKKELRSAQRSITAKERLSLHGRIMASSEGADQLFFKLIKKQCETKCKPATLDFGQFKSSSEPNSWAKYYEDLATPKQHDVFDNEYYRSMQIQNLLLSLLNKPVQADAITEDAISMHLKKLKSNKASDLYGISAEHFKLASPRVVHILTHISWFAHGF
jgi:hypothetical protein